MNSIERLKRLFVNPVTLIELAQNEAMLFPDDYIRYFISYIATTWLSPDTNLRSHPDNNYIGEVNGYNYTSDRVTFFLPFMEEISINTEIAIEAEDDLVNNSITIPGHYKVHIIENCRHIKIFLPGTDEYLLMSSYSVYKHS